MKALFTSFFFLSYSLSSNASSVQWGSECVGYYEFELPIGAEIALYPLAEFTNPRPDKMRKLDVIIKRFKTPEITFSESQYGNGDDSVQAQFSEFYYDKYKVGISSKSKNEINFKHYREKVIDDYEFSKLSNRLLEEQDFSLYNEPMTSEEDFNRIHGFLVKDDMNAFTVYSRRTYSVQINGDGRIYQFWAKREPYLEDQSQTAENQWHKKEPEVKSLLSRFTPRELYEVPNKQGFCIPYGFIADDSGQEPHNMAVTYRLKEHPDVSIFVQDLGMAPDAGEETKMDPKEYVTWLWNWQYQWRSVNKELISPKWRTIEMDGRKGLGTFAKAEFEDGRVDYGYVAYVRGDHHARNVQPDLLVYVMQYSVQAKDRPPMDKKEIEKMAERIVASVKRR